MGLIHDIAILIENLDGIYTEQMKRVLVLYDDGDLILEADNVLITLLEELGFEEVIEEYKKVCKVNKE